MAGTDDCPICLDALSTKENTAIEPCGHYFHVDCIIRWFRTDHDECPQCRSFPSPRVRIMRSRNTTLRHFARRKDAPRELKALVTRLRHAEEAERTVAKEARDHCRTHAEVFHMGRHLRQRRWRAAGRVRRLKRELTHYSFLVR